jgi:hypothetical protein
MDNNLQFWFRLLQPDASPLDRLICLAEHDNVCHVEAFFRGRFFSADITRGVRFLDEVPYQDDPSGYWDVFPVPEPVDDVLQAWAESIVGSRYDVFGAINSAMGIPLHDPYRWFCSLLASAVGSRVGIANLDPLPSPSLLRQQLKMHTGLATSNRQPVPGLDLADEDFAYVQQLVEARSIDPETAQKIISHCQGATP